MLKEIKLKRVRVLRFLEALIIQALKGISVSETPIGACLKPRYFLGKMCLKPRYF